MNAIFDDVKKLVKKERESAAKHFPFFRSAHEAVAIVREEVEEAHDEMVKIECRLNFLWRKVKKNKFLECNECIVSMEEVAANLACEAIQIAALCEKILLSQSTIKEYEGGNHYD